MSHWDSLCAKERKFSQSTSTTTACTKCVCLLSVVMFHAAVFCKPLNMLPTRLVKTPEVESEPQYDHEQTCSRRVSPAGIVTRYVLEYGRDGNVKVAILPLINTCCSLETVIIVPSLGRKSVRKTVALLLVRSAMTSENSTVCERTGKKHKHRQHMSYTRHSQASNMIWREQGCFY